MTEGTFQLDQGALPLLMPSRIERAGSAHPESAPACPACGGSTVRRIARSGPRAGGHFWGCTDFPACRGRLDIAGATDRSARAGAAASGDAGTVAPRTTARPASAMLAARPATALVAAAAAQAAARHGIETIARASAAAFGGAKPLVQRAAARAVDFALDVLHPAPASDPVGGRNMAGASAQAEFERRRSRHRMKMRAALPAAAAVTLIAMVMVFVALLGYGLPAAALATLAAGGVGVWAIGRLPADALAWGRGADGERRTAEYLDTLTALGYIVLHDRVIPGLRANIDHVAIGPAGVFLIETKNLRGKLTIVGEKLFVGERTRTGIVDETYREALAVQVCLADRLNVLRQTVRPVLCVHRTVQLLLDNEVQGVRVVSGPQLIRFVRRLPTLLDAETVQDLASVADGRLLPAVP